jgi:hypothetical protein
MEILKNEDLIQSWIEGHSQMTNHKRTLEVSTSGALWSYRLKIGQRTDAGICVIADYTAPKRQFRSVTTSTHVGLAKRLISRSGGLVMHPLVWKTSPLSEEAPF